MANTTHEYLRLIQDTLRVEHGVSGVTALVSGYDSGWRYHPWLTVSQTVDSRFAIYFDGGIEHIAEPGEAYCSMPGVHHRILKLGKKASVARWSHLHISILGSLDIGMLLEFPAIYRGAMAVAIGEISELLVSLKPADNGIDDSSGDGSLARVVARQAAVYELAAVVTAGAQPREQAELLRAGALRLAPVLGHIHRHLHEPMTRELLAGLVHLSPSAFYRLFREALGEAPTDYVARLRLERAQQLLASGELGVQEVAHRSGFADAFHFSRTFKKRFGHSPLEYRRRVREGRL